MTLFQSCCKKFIIFLQLRLLTPLYLAYSYIYICNDLLIILKYHCCIHSTMQRILENMEVEESTQCSQDLVGRMVL